MAIGEGTTQPSDGSHISIELLRYLEDIYIPSVLLALELNYWRVYIAMDKPPSDALLMIEPTDGRRIAMLYVSENWITRLSEDKRIDVTHECLHLMHHDQEEVIRRFKRNQGDVGHYAMGLVWEQFEIETERMVDSLSYIIAPWMPDWEGPE